MSTFSRLLFVNTIPHVSISSHSFVDRTQTLFVYTTSTTEFCCRDVKDHHGEDEVFVCVQVKSNQPEFTEQRTDQQQTNRLRFFVPKLVFALQADGVPIRVHMNIHTHKVNSVTIKFTTVDVKV
ncbi:hypothetical protein X801_03764 [Opisthorchis viverrini]|uniref:Uncharacterized protein n=1 Tax=Opisthorchis viverrini TaxID=6198 RepID=A0A1S8X0V1_OPIVI|nr:hypothetical protein X801_03764 [Opisthorchis viverrini]